MRWIVLIGILCLLYTGCSAPQTIGGEKDSHGCLIAAGYSWCEAKQECIRAWEENCTSEESGCAEDEWLCSLTGECVKKGEICTNGMMGGDIDEHGCKPSAGYSWCEATQECIRSWEEECPDQLVGDDMDEHGCIGSAGYTWCESKQKCLRTWEEDCPEI